MKNLEEVYDKLKSEYNLSNINIGFVDPDANMDDVYISTKATLDKLFSGDYEEADEYDE